MVSKFVKTGLATAVAVSLSFSFADAKRLGAELWGATGDQDAKFMALTEKINELGFVVSDPHPKINEGYKHKFGSTTLDNLGFFSVTNDKAMRELLIAHPDLGAFAPLNLHIYKWADKDVTWVGHLRPEVMADMAGLHDIKLRNKFASLFPALDKMTIEQMGATKVNNIYFDTLPEKPLMKFELEFDLADYEDDIEMFVEEFQESYEEAFEEAGYLIAGYKNFKEVYEYMDGEPEFPFEAYWTYSLCHFSFSNAIFNTTPEAGLFAPCSVYMYVKEGENKLHIGMPRLENWIKVAGVNSEEHKKMIRELDAEITKVLVEELGFTEVE